MKKSKDTDMTDLAIFQNTAVDQFTKFQNQIVDIITNNSGRLLSLIDIKESTIQTYRDSIKPFLAFVQDQGINVGTVGDYKKALAKDKTIGVSTKKKRLAAVKGLLRVCYQNNIIPIDITLNVKGFKQTVEHKKDGLTGEEVELVRAYIGAMKEGCKKTRFNTMFYLLTYQGLRTYELIGLKVEDVNIKQGTIKVLGKGNDDTELVYLHPKTAKAIEEYLKCCEVKSGYLFTTKYKGETKQLTRHAVIRMFTRSVNGEEVGLLGKAGVSGRTVHGFRHFFTTTMLEVTGGDILLTMKFTRHKSPSQLKVYDDRRIYKKKLTGIHTDFDTFIK